MHEQRVDTTDSPLLLVVVTVVAGRSLFYLLLVHTIFSQKVWWISWQLSFILGLLTVALIEHLGGQLLVLHLLHVEGRSEGGSEGSIACSGSMVCNAAAKVSEGRR